MPNKPLDVDNSYSMKHGFTMIELLVVIAIIAILVAAGVVSFTTAQKKTRDTKRRSDMQDVQKAFEQWYGKNTRYPTNSAPDNCITALDNSYLGGGFPKDPKNTGTYVYNYNTCDATGTSYCSCALLESPTSGNSSVSDCSTFGTGAYFCVKGVQ